MTNTSSQYVLPPCKTKIICTIGPGSRSVSTLEQLVHEGMTIARLNFSHGSFEEHLKVITTIRTIEQKTGKVIPIMIDLPGAKIRVGKLESEPILLATGSLVSLTTKKVLGTQTCIPIDFIDLPSSVSVGNTIFLNDGFIELLVTKIQGTDVECKVVMGGLLHSRKGVNLPGGKLHVDPVTAIDLDIVQFGLKHGISIFSASFVEKQEDIKKIRDFTKKQETNIFIIAKVERDEAIQHFDEILAVSDGIMIARGDLGIQIPLQDVPRIQKQLIHKANQQGKPVITATQMLKSMTENSRPTRAEVADVANAIYDGTDAVMLSEETAIGQYPVESVSIMVKIAQATETKRNYQEVSSTLHQQLQCTSYPGFLSIADVISYTVNQAQQLIHPRYILVTTESGNAARRISRFKPESWILAFSRNPDTCRFLLFSSGIWPIHMQNPLQSWHKPILDFLKKQQLTYPGDIVLLTQRRFSKEKGRTDSFGIITINDNN